MPNDKNISQTTLIWIVKIGNKTNAGPGQIEPKPQPNPKRDAPIINFASSFVLVGICNFY